MQLLVCHVRRRRLSIPACLMRGIEDKAETSAARLWLGRATNKVGSQKKAGPPARDATMLTETRREVAVNQPQLCGTNLFRAMRRGGFFFLLTAASGAAAQADASELRCGDTIVRLVCQTRADGGCLRSDIVFEPMRGHARTISGTRYVPQDFEAVTTAREASCYHAGATSYVSLLYTFNPASAMNSYVRFFDLEGRLVRTRAALERINQIESTRISASVSID